MSRTLCWSMLAALLAALVVGCRSKLLEPRPCEAAKPPNALTAAMPEWKLEPNMFLWEHTPNDQPYPATDLGYSVQVTNLGSKSARNLHVYLGSQLFGWQEMRLDHGKVDETCPDLPPGQRNTWDWGHTWRSKNDPSWRKSMEQTAELRLVWQDEDGWHEMRGKLPSQYSPRAFEASNLK